jgi:hypothetical protein
MWGVFLITVVSVVVTFAIVFFRFVLVALMTVVVTNDGIVVRIPAAFPRFYLTVFVVVSSVVLVTDHLMACRALRGTVAVGLADRFSLGFLAFEPFVVMFYVLRRKTGTFMVLFGEE